MRAVEGGVSIIEISHLVAYAILGTLLVAFGVMVAVLGLRARRRKRARHRAYSAYFENK